MTEVQVHGFTFEKWVRDQLFGGYEGGYGQKWDVPAEENHSSALPAAWRGLDVSIKTAKYGSPIGLGDVLRQRQIDEPFLMIVGFWHQRTFSEKWMEEIGVVGFSAAAWSELWGELSLEELRAIDLVVKNVGLPHTEVRRRARDWKKMTPAVATSSLVVNPKIDSKSQRRIQCSLPFTTFWKAADRVPHRKDFPELFGVPFPNPMSSSARKFGS